jgi:hypothetical protein
MPVFCATAMLPAAVFIASPWTRLGCPDSLTAAGLMACVLAGLTGR